ncbi:MAG: nucleotidyltransferase domain-containing protein [Gammaproteobacteria bacterium]|nr:nucleotidyltransferase domain-containing protein [Gammaproteobacteria bacterium]OYY24409.1 MAG: DNA polymerase subunit beta [Thiotrichales bacterium 35-46-9]OYZ42331.1 MAG: DNA polymerase subunit beta [Thiotrichales bacterium 24-47-4]OZA75248.1 MAG: DNA polymerase subunit beta [Thiotrichales bacterium 39-47-5]OZB86637.1 MAG: DNA polymerase subunit beta [Thiotrichales bacterium 12-47-6]HQR81531.1 nucleotidyltransferase domain-containing protein [Thiotrichales bacterium]
MPIVQEIQQPTKELVIQEVAKVFFNLLALYAFGSRIQGTANAQSDLDLAVLVEGYADPMQLFELSNKLADQLGYEVDLLDMRAASTVMQYQVLTRGERWWVKDALPVGLFETMVLSEKTNLDEVRAGLLADIQARGRVYG